MIENKTIMEKFAEIEELANLIVELSGEEEYLALNSTDNNIAYEPI